MDNKDKVRHRGSLLKQCSSFDIVKNIIVTVAAICSFVPFWLVIINSFATEMSISKYGFSIWPNEFTLRAYQYVFQGKQIFYSYRTSILIVVIGTPISLLITTMYAYMLSHRKVKYRRALSFMTYFTMLMGTAIVGFYILISTWLGLKDTIWALVLPRMLNPFYAFILVSSFREVPYEIYEAANVDGANEMLTLFRIICPIVMPGLATVGLFYCLMYWNDWWLSMLFIDDYKLHPLQMMIRGLINSMNANSYVGGDAGTGEVIPTHSVKMAVVCLTVGPIILAYPFVQRFFVKGITIGAVKG